MTTTSKPSKNTQFENIARLKADYLTAGDPVISIDTQKKELIGDFAREGHTQASVDSLDQDFPSAGQGKLISHGIYDLARNEGAIHLNTSHLCPVGMTPANYVTTASLCGGNGRVASTIPRLCEY